MTDKDIYVITQNLKSLSIADLSRILGEGLVQTLSSLGHSITKNFLIEAILKIKGTGIFSSKIIRDHFAELAETEVINTWSGAKKCKELLQYFDLSEAFLPSSKSSRKISAETEPGFILHDYQDHIKREVSNFLIKETDKNKLMVQLPTGAGKTSLAMESIYDFFRIAKDCKCIVWMAHTDELCEQAVESFIRGWQQKGTFKVRIIRLWGGRATAVLDEIQDDTPTFVVTSFQSANSMLSTSSNEVMLAFTKIRSKTKLLVVDEAHMTLAETYQQSIEMFSGENCKILGLTATPGRHGIGGDEEETIELARFYEKNLINMDSFCGGLSPLAYLQEKGILSNVKRKKLVTDYGIDISAEDSRNISQQLAISYKTLERVGNDAKRNLLIIDQIQLLLEKEERKKILVFASSKANSDLLSAMLLLRNIEAISVTGETETSYRANTVTRFKNNEFQVLINFGVFTTGFDDPLIDCILIARPTFSVVLYSQMIGRGLRGTKNNGTEDCLIVDLIDNVINQPDLHQASDYFYNQWLR